MTIKLRAHHLLCMLTYVGKGYSVAFTKNYDRIIARIAAGEDILIQEGPDDVCQPLLGDSDPHCFRDSVVERDAKAAADVGRLLGKTIQAGDVLTLDGETVARFRGAFGQGTTRTACAGCEWFDLCSTISKADYADTRLQLPSL
ncbi:DUF1284 domain-containing protein [Phyllobacterium meliloti]|uniref:DUF1284 domain-containing protein n=1 Tax=Phyllobacterium meliloti TaxID=555317 RepID=UPI001D1543AD|nr:DUF1284 domain-containing protein [Phyllobacterium sp. T1293]UGX86117.1 DUF1284 domain-containing protein [Phyllobacterium sp. T1293]